MSEGTPMTRAEAIEAAARELLAATVRGEEYRTLLAIGNAALGGPMEAVSDQPDRMESARTALESALALPDDGGWLGIETAPKDGTEVDLYWPYWRKEPVVGNWVGGWDSSCKLSEGPDPVAWRPRPSPPANEVQQ